MSVFNFSTKEYTKENYNELLDDSSVLNFDCVEECIFSQFDKVALKKVCIDLQKLLRLNFISQINISN